MLRQTTVDGRRVERGLRDGDWMGWSSAHPSATKQTIFEVGFVIAKVPNGSLLQTQTQAGTGRERIMGNPRPTDGEPNRTESQPTESQPSRVCSTRALADRISEALGCDFSEVSYSIPMPPQQAAISFDALTAPPEMRHQAATRRRTATGSSSVREAILRCTWTLDIRS